MDKQIEFNKPLVFIDTNIFLDFYRMRNNEIRIEYLKKIESIKTNLITTYQIEMEYKKNRQGVIIESVNNLHNNSKSNINVPVFVSDFKPARKLFDLNKEFKTQYDKVSKKIIKTLDNPTSNDAVYQSLQRLFKKESKYKLEKDSDDFIEIVNYAKERFELGYPPRKKSDNSVGDAINWEWIIKCAKNSTENIIIVTRDSDYGMIYKNNIYLNDWLNQEFKQRVSQKRKISITMSLAQALKQFNLTISKEMEKEENEVIFEQHSSQEQNCEIES